jgi:nucleoside-diphosphate-sugar epimerase
LYYLICLRCVQLRSAVDDLERALEKIEDGSPINAGREDRITLNQAADLVFEIVGWRPKRITHDLSKPQGVASRAADITRARRVLGWGPKVSYAEGFKRTIEWYFANNNEKKVKANLDRLLMER